MRDTMKTTTALIDIQLSKTSHFRFHNARKSEVALNSGRFFRATSISYLPAAESRHGACDTGLLPSSCRDRSGRATGSSEPLDLAIQVLEPPLEYLNRRELR